ncbi:hypothetical protein [Actinoplanes rectilineatus]|uniref:hypothetical protein n=1 Tax=Actinoplanes rectilineatus TaxID=113571 RepID=UPI0005F28D19|nr:hypothetical protein [Actinoplanes rectilineatus]
MWKVDDGTRWVRWDEGRGPSASAGLQDLLVGPWEPVEWPPDSGRVYTPVGDSDPLAVFLHARDRLGPRARIIGAPPPYPLPEPAGSPDGYLA